FEQMFLEEARLASRIRHPNVVETLDVGEENEVLYLVMEWIDGEALSTLLRKRKDPFPVGIAARIVTQAAAGLHAAHELRDEDDTPLELVHRDVAPQNLIVTSEGATKVVDFGLAKTMGRRSGASTVGHIKGKVAYMSPEQALCERIDRRSDVFALGAV